MKKISLNTPLMLVLNGNYIHKTICKHLMNQGICSIRELCMYDEESLKGLKGIKEKSIVTIKSVLAEYGLHLGMCDSLTAEYAKDMPAVQLPKNASTLPKIDWEQRRYEISKDAYIAFFPEIIEKGIQADEAAKASVLFAECLILELQMIQNRKETK
ncbi:MAG: hypothetical protein IJE78_01285 [Bacteroidaceae bacterium]|nr:hypothetical protein [Bacteroidaceae bacterium]